MNVAGRILGVWISAGAALVAADFWDEKDFATWSDKEVEKMLTDSPWAKRVRVSIGGPGSGGGFSPYSREENFQRASAVRDGRARAGDDNIRGRGRGDGFAEGPPRVVLTVSWRSALPIKQALVRAQAGIGAAVPPDQRPFLIQQEPLYLVSISGIPRQFGEGLNREAVLERTTLERRRCGSDSGRGCGAILGGWRDLHPRVCLPERRSDHVAGPERRIRHRVGRGRDQTELQRPRDDVRRRTRHVIGPLRESTRFFSPAVSVDQQPLAVSVDRHGTRAPGLPA